MFGNFMYAIMHFDLIYSIHSYCPCYPHYSPPILGAFIFDPSELKIYLPCDPALLSLTMEQKDFIILGIGILAALFLLIDVLPQ